MENQEQQSAVSFVIPGVPVGKGRLRFARRGRFVTTYTPEKTANYENLVKIIAAKAMGSRPPIDGAVSVEIDLYVTPPASWSKKKQQAALDGLEFPTTKPDIDNSIKGIFDACNEIVWKDDKQVVDVKARKRYSSTAKATMRVSSL